MGDVERHGAQRSVLAGAQRQRLVVVAGLYTDDAGEVAADAVGQGAAENVRRGHAVGIAVVLAGRDAVFDLAFTDHDRQAGERLGGHPAAAVRFDDGDLQVAVGAGRIDVADLERPWRHTRGVQDVVVLADLHGGVGLCHATDDWRITALAIGAHAFIGSQFDPAIAHTVEQVGVGEDIPGTELALDGRDVMLQVAAVTFEGARATGAAGEVRLVAKTPGAQVDAVAQAQVVGNARVGIAGAAAAVELVVDKRCRHAVIPQCRVDVTTDAALHRYLRHAGRQLQARGVIAQAGLVDQRWQVIAALRGVRVEFALGLQFVQVDAQLLQQFQGQARFYAPGCRVAVEIDVPSAHQYFVAVQVDPVVAWQHAVGRQQQLQINRRGRALQEGGVERFQLLPVAGVLLGQGRQRGKHGQRQRAQLQQAGSSSVSARTLAGAMSWPVTGRKRHAKEPVSSRITTGRGEGRNHARG
uniref:Uncharacterized protein n=1 Tax=Pseudomonas fluorescens TaxID=294 RepID=A0A5E6XKN6_PSEFL|nr:hypothetical protein PS652_05490 [Pseudomonas fluorescens]